MCSSDLLAPRSMHIKIAMDAKLRNEARQNTKESPLVEIMQPEQLVESVHAMRRPLAPRLHHKITLRSLKLYAKHLGNNNFRRRLAARSSHKSQQGSRDKDLPRSHSPIIADMWTSRQ